MRARRLIVLLFCCAVHCGYAQIDTVAAVVDTSNVPTEPFGVRMKRKWQMQPHSPLKATVLSAVIPGAGQIYNKKYWKAPIAWGGEALCIWFIAENNKQYQYYKGEYVKLALGQPSVLGNVNPADVNREQETYHRWRDLSYMCLVGVHILQIIDANVDAHLTYYEIGDDLTLHVLPSAIPAGRITPGISFTLGF